MRAGPIRAVLDGQASHGPLVCSLTCGRNAADAYSLTCRHNAADAYSLTCRHNAADGVAMTALETAPSRTGGGDDPPTGGDDRWRALVGAVGRVLITAGVVIGLFAAYQVWGTGLHESRAQDDLRSDWEAVLATARTAGPDLTAPADPPSPTDTAAPGEPASPSPDDADDPTVAPDDDADDPTVAPEDDIDDPTVAPEDDIDRALLELLFPAEGDALARIEIPAIGVDKVVVRGVQVADLRNGPGHYPATELPGHRGNAAVAGHRTTYGAPFGRIDELVPGDEIVVTTVQGRFSYEVLDPGDAYLSHADRLAGVGDGHAVVAPGDSWVLDDFGDDRLTLTACHPRFSARQRIIVAAALTSTPVGLPQPVAELVAEVEATEAADDTGTEAMVEGTADDGTETYAGSPLPAGFDLDRLTSTNDLDEGLGGDTGEWPVAVAWLLAAGVVWGLVTVGAHRFDSRARWAVRGALLVPLAWFLWRSFEAADRALPAFGGG